MNLLFSVFTHYQLITAIQIKLSLYPNERADIIISDHSMGYKTIAAALEKLSIFEHVYISDNVESIKADNILKKIGRAISIAFNNNKFPIKCTNIEEYEYDEFLFYNLNYYNTCLYYLMKRRNPALVAKRFEEGYGSCFSADISSSGSTRLQQKFEKLHRNPRIADIEEMFFYEPELVLFKNEIKASPIPKIDKNDENMKRILNTIFDYKVSDEYDRKYIFFEEAYCTDGKEIDDLELVLKIAAKVGRENLMVKLHPRSRVDRFAEYGIKTNKAVGVPWEVIIMNNNFSDKVFLTISSGSVLSPRILFGENVPTYMLFNCTKVKSHLVTDSFYQFLELFKNKYGNSGFYIPDTLSDFIDNLHIW